MRVGVKRCGVDRGGVVVNIEGDFADAVAEVKVDAGDRSIVVTREGVRGVGDDVGCDGRKLFITVSQGLKPAGRFDLRCCVDSLRRSALRSSFSF